MRELQAQVAMLREALATLLHIEESGMAVIGWEDAKAKAHAALAAESTAAEYRRTIENEAIDKCCDAAHDAIHQAIFEVDQCEDVKAAVNSALESLKG